MFVQLVAEVGFVNSQNDKHFGSLSARKVHTSQARVCNYRLNHHDLLVGREVNPDPI